MNIFNVNLSLFLFFSPSCLIFPLKNSISLIRMVTTGKLVDQDFIIFVMDKVINTWIG